MGGMGRWQQFQGEDMAARCRRGRAPLVGPGRQVEPPLTWLAENFIIIVITRIHCQKRQGAPAHKLLVKAANILPPVEFPYPSQHPINPGHSVQFSYCTPPVSMLASCSAQSHSQFELASRSPGILTCHMRRPVSSRKLAAGRAA